MTTCWALLLAVLASVNLAGATRPTKMPSHIASYPEKLIEKAEALIMNSKVTDNTFDPEKDTWVQHVGSKPRVFYFHNFLSQAERTHIIQTAAPQMKRSTVVGHNGGGVVDNIRTSYGTFLRRLQDDVIERVERRIALYTMLPVEHQEDIQVLRYGINQTYGAHYDSSEDEHDAGPHHRIATFLMYLSDVEQGGETAFPLGSEWVDPSIPSTMGEVSDCAKGHVAAKPKAGDAVLFWSLKPDGSMDPAAMHTGCPVIKGIKWAAPVWIHTKPFRPEGFKRPNAKELQFLDPGKCADYHDMCTVWAEAKECQTNSAYMMGDGDSSPGMCRKACRSCEMCNSGDFPCINRNRENAGYLHLNKTELEWLGISMWEPSPEL